MMTITKISAFVIFLAGLCLTVISCQSVSLGSRETAVVPVRPDTYLPAFENGRITSREITESSGIAASKCQENVLWTHNDSGDGPFIYAIDLQGRHLGTWKIPNVSNFDWEDIATFRNKDGTCFIYIGEIGNNRRRRAESEIFRITEPLIEGAGGSNRRKPVITPKAEKLRFVYPDVRQDAEALLVHPTSGEIYVISKLLTGAAGVYSVQADFDSPNAILAKKIGELSLPAVPNGLVTGGDISPDGRRVVVSDYFSGYELVLAVDEESFDEIWRSKPQPFDIGSREIGEAVAYGADGMSVFSTSEKRNSPVYKTLRKPE